MDTTTYDNAITVGSDEYPFYTSEVVKASRSLPQGVASRTDADTVDGFNAVSAIKAGPNKLVATGSDGKLPLTVFPTFGTLPGVVGMVSGTYAGLKASPPAGYALGLATDQGVAGTLYFYLNNASAGDNGWILIGGS